MVAINSKHAPLAFHQVRPAIRLAPRERRVAVVLNRNARKVDAETLRWVHAVVPGDDLFVSRSIDDAARVAETILERGFDAVLWGGGDGTFALGVSSLAAAAEERGLAMPEVGVLRLGTGNAMAEALGAGPATAQGLAEDLRRARASISRRRVTLLSVEGRPSMFCGFGLDAQILDDFAGTVSMLKRAGIADRVKSAGLRYFLAVTSRSIPRFLLAQRTEVVAINRGSPATRVDVDGDPVGAPIPAGRVLWRGLASLASAASIPFYGLGMRMFPHADRVPGRFQLRLSDMGTAEALAQLPAVWKGRSRSARLHDFLVDEVELVLSRPSPFQSAGDLIGERQQVTIGMWDRPIVVV
jgi:diacylglycerol kinase family enzyme